MELLTNLRINNSIILHESLLYATIQWWSQVHKFSSTSTIFFSRTSTIFLNTSTVHFFRVRVRTQIFEYECSTIFSSTSSSTNFRVRVEYRKKFFKKKIKIKSFLYRLNTFQGVTSERCASPRLCARPTLQRLFPKYLGCRKSNFWDLGYEDRNF